MYYFILLYFY